MATLESSVVSGAIEVDETHPFIETTPADVERVISGQHGRIRPRGQSELKLRPSTLPTEN